MTDPRTPEAPVSNGPGSPFDASPYEPAETIPAGRVSGSETGPLGATQGGRRSRLRWGIALVGVLVIALGSFAIVSLVGGKPSVSAAMGYVPADTLMYTEVRLDLPGDQRQKLAAFLQKAVPGFADSSTLESKIDEAFDKLVRSATDDKQAWTTDIKPWFGGQIAIGMGAPAIPAPALRAMAGDALGVVTVIDRAKALAWITKTAGNAALTRSTVGGADLFSSADGSGAIAVNDRVMLFGSAASVKAALATDGKGTFAQDEAVKAAVATLDKDVVGFAVARIRAAADAAVALRAKESPSAVDHGAIQAAVLDMLPAWQAMTLRFEDDQIAVSAVGPTPALGVDRTNRASDVAGHVPPNALFYADMHDVGPALTAVLAKFRAVDEAKPAFEQLDKALALLGGADAVYGWWGDTAIVVTPLSDGTIGGGLVIHPRDADKATRLITSIGGFLAIGGSSQGLVTRTEDHNGTQITIVDGSQAIGGASASLPPGYKAEIAWATNKDITVIGYGAEFVREVLDAKPGASLADDARYKALLGRVGAENTGVSFVDLAGLRALLEPIAKAQVPAAEWDHYVSDVQPFLKAIDAIISSVRQDGPNQRATGVVTVH